MRCYANNNDWKKYWKEFLSMYGTIYKKYLKHIIPILLFSGLYYLYLRMYNSFGLDRVLILLLVTIFFTLNRILIKIKK